MDDNFFCSATNRVSEGHTQWNVPAVNATGFSANNHTERAIDLNEQLVKSPATFFMRVNSDAMIDAGIYKGDVVIVDRSLEARNGKIIIALVDGELLIRKLEINNGRKRLRAMTNKLAAIEIDDSRFSCWGVVTYVIRSV